MDVLLKELDADGILTLTLNRPDKLNALSGELLFALAEALDEAKVADGVRGIIITGSGKAFCAGADINRLLACNAQTGMQFAQDGQAVFARFTSLGKPSMSVVNGYAFGGGCELLISTTLRVASEKAQFGQPEIKLGVIPGFGGTQRLARLIGKGRAMDLCITGRSIDAQTALNYGLITALYPAESLLADAKQAMRQIISMAPIALKGIMESIDYGYNMSLQDALHLEAVQFAKVCATKDKNEGVSAFLEKRAPIFIGE